MACGTAPGHRPGPTAESTPDSGVKIKRTAGVSCSSRMEVFTGGNSEQGNRLTGAAIHSPAAPNISGYFWAGSPTAGAGSVSYTHLDVYKRQVYGRGEQHDQRK